MATPEKGGAAKLWPTSLNYDPGTKILCIVFGDDTVISLPAEYLRVESPSAEVQGHSLSEKKIVPGRRHVGIMDIEPVGNYAVRLIFDDLHDTGIYSWRYLYELGQEQDVRWPRYLDALETRGLSRDP
jgi:DUF971 family protein